MSNKIGQARREMRSCIGKPVAFQIRDGFGASMVPVLEDVLRGRKVYDADLYEAVTLESEAAVEQRDAMAAKLAGPMIIPAGRGGKSTAMVSMRGMALYDVEYQPMAFSTALLAQTMNALAGDESIGAIVLMVDSPGGVVTGVKEAGDAIFAARAKKPVVAVVNPLCASAALWLASQATEIVAVPSAEIGSVGVFMLHAECSKMLEMDGVKPTFIFAKDSPYKTEGNSFEPLSDEAKDYFQAEADEIMSEFVAALARGRGVNRAKVLSDFGQGRTMSAQKAKAAGMIDRVATLNVALAKYGLAPEAQDKQGRRVEAGGLDTEALAAFVGQKGAEVIAPLSDENEHAEAERENAAENETHQATAEPTPEGEGQAETDAIVSGENDLPSDAPDAEAQAARNKRARALALEQAS